MHFILLLMLLLLECSSFEVVALSRSKVRTLPGYPGLLPFQLETGEEIDSRDRLLVFIIHRHRELQKNTDTTKPLIHSPTTAAGRSCVEQGFSRLGFGKGWKKGSTHEIRIVLER
ncbi:hypothetical protein IFM89_023326, partial [Coptis chinensis]